MYTNSYRIGEHTLPSPSNANFKLHNHDEYEILLFLEGDAKYVVEDKSYTLEPGDIILIRRHELHRIYHNSNIPYRRIIIMVSPLFFVENNCTSYEAQFVKTPVGTGHKIPADLVRSSGLFDAFLRYRKYSENYTLDKSSPILISTLIEILYLINKITTFSDADFTSSPIKSVIHYINRHYTEDISLDLLHEKFFVSKYHLCRAFHKATGLTIHEYIRRKRITKVRELYAEGMNLGDAAVGSGFSDYSSFYRAYRKEYGTSPKKDL